MKNLFFAYLSNTINITFFILLLLLIEPLLKKYFSAICLYRIWVVLLIGLLIPMRFPLSSPLFHLGLPRTSLTDEVENITALPFDSGPIISPSGLFHTQLPYSYQNTASRPSQSISNNIFEKLPSQALQLIYDAYFILLLIWLSGAALFLIYNLYQYHSYRRHMKRFLLPIHQEEVICIFRQCLLKTKGYFLPGFMNSRQNKKIVLYQCSALFSPMTIGLIKPILLLPDKPYTKKELELLLMHELIHIRRRDSLVKLLRLGALSLNWFNPFCYILLKHTERWCEASCDEILLRNASRAECMHYSRLLLECASAGSMCSSTLFTNFYGGKSNMKQRLALILNQTKKRSGKIITALFLGLVATTAIITITNQAVFASNQADSEAITTTPTPAGNDSTAAASLSDDAAPVTDEAQSLREKAVSIALEAKGAPYLWGGNDLKTGTDCSGFVQAVYKELGYDVPRTSREQYKVCTEVSLEDLLPGDLIFYSDEDTGEINHVAIYIGNGQVIHSKNSRDGVVVCDISYHWPNEGDTSVRTPSHAGRIITE